MNSTLLSRSDLWLCLVLLLLGIVFFGVGIGAYDLWSPDEPRFGQVTREMLQRRDAFVLYLNDSPYSDKPPLHIWISALVAMAQGWQEGPVSSFAARFPSVLGGLIGLIATYFLAVAMFGSRRAGFISALVLGSTCLYVLKSSRAQLDMLMTGWCTVAMLAAWMIGQTSAGWRRSLWWALLWSMGALATLSKGPPGIIVPLGTIAFYRMWQSDARRAGISSLSWCSAIVILTLFGKFSFFAGWPMMALLLLALSFLFYQVWIFWIRPFNKSEKFAVEDVFFGLMSGMLLFVGIVGIWFVPYYLNAPIESSSDTLFSQTVTRYFSATHHAKPIYYFLIHLPMNLAPWTFFFLAAVSTAYSCKSCMRDSSRRFLSCWILFTFLFFSLSPAKREQYLLPSLPAYALFCGWLFNGLITGQLFVQERLWRIPAMLNTILAGLITIGSALFYFLICRGTQPFSGLRASILAEMQIDRFDISTLPMLELSVLSFACMMILIISIRRKAIAGVVLGSALLMGFGNLYFNNFLFPAINTLNSGRELSRRIDALREPDDHVGSFGFYRATYHCYGGYFLERIHSRKEQNQKDLREFLDTTDGKRAFVIFREKDFLKIRQSYPDIPIRDLFHTVIGGRELVIVDNQRKLLP